MESSSHQRAPSISPITTCNEEWWCSTTFISLPKWQVSSKFQGAKLTNDEFTNLGTRKRQRGYTPPTSTNFTEFRLKVPPLLGGICCFESDPKQLRLFCESPGFSVSSFVLLPVNSLVLFGHVGVFSVQASGLEQLPPLVTDSARAQLLAFAVLAFLLLLLLGFGMAKEGKLPWRPWMLGTWKTQFSRNAATHCPSTWRPKRYPEKPLFRPHNPYD